MLAGSRLAAQRLPSSVNDYFGTSQENHDAVWVRHPTNGKMEIGKADFLKAQYISHDGGRVSNKKLCSSVETSGISIGVFSSLGTEFIATIVIFIHQWHAAERRSMSVWSKSCLQSGYAVLRPPQESVYLLSECESRTGDEKGLEVQWYWGDENRWTSGPSHADLLQSVIRM